MQVKIKTSAAAAAAEGQPKAPPTAWQPPNAQTIQFSDKKLKEMFKQFQFIKEDKLVEIGDKLQSQVLAALENAAAQEPQLDTTQVSVENQKFLRRMTALVGEFSRYTQRDPLSKMSQLDHLKIDLLYLHTLQNTLCEYFQHLAAILRRVPDQADECTLLEQDGGENGPYTYESVKTVILALRMMVNQASNCAYFGCLQVILQVITAQQSIKTRPKAFQRQSLSINEDLTVLLETVFHRMFQQKRPFMMLCGSQEKWDFNFKDVTAKYQTYCEAIMSNFATLAQLMLYKQGKGAPSHMKILQEQEGCELQSKLDKLITKCDFLVSTSDLEDVRNAYTLHAYTMSLLMGQYFDLVKSQRAIFEKQMDPWKVVQNLILIVSSPDTFYNAQVRVSSLKMLEFLCELDAHPEFRYQDERHNPYFEVVVKHFQDFVSIADKFAEFYNQSNLDQFVNEMEAAEQSAGGMQVDEVATVALGTKGASAYSSQMFLRAYLAFMQVLIGFRTRAMQTQLFPQLVDPIVRIVTVKPANRHYVVNLDCQKTALQILKEITRTNISFDNQSQLMMMLGRLKVELGILKEDYDNYDSRDTHQSWMPFKYDDSQFQSHSLAKRQDLIGSFLRFLCYTIIKMDPNQISINQNFVAHSRKILESRIFEDCLQDLVFLANPAKGAENQPSHTEKFEKVIDPIFLTCVQLCTYVFNDLHQKIGEYIENGLLPCIIDSLSRRVPRQHDFLVLTGKFMRLLTLNANGTRLLLESRILANIQAMALEHESFNDFYQLQQNRDQLTLLSQLASESQELSDQMMRTNTANLEFVIEESWRVTEAYLESERLNAEPGQTEEQIEQRKDTYNKRQSEFEKTVENVCYMLLFQVHEQLDVLSVGGQLSQNNVSRSIGKQENLLNVVKRVITTPTICSAASNFLIIFSDLATVIVMMTGAETFKGYISWLHELLVGQISALKTFLGVSQLNKFNPRDKSKLKTMRQESLAEQDPDKLELLFTRYQISADDQLWVTVAKIHAYLDLLLITEAITRPLQRDDLHRHCLDYFTRKEVGQTPDCLRTQILQLEELLQGFKYAKYVEKLQAKISLKSHLLGAFAEKIKQVDWAEFTEILEPQNDFEDALNLQYKLEYATCQSYQIEDSQEIKSRFRLSLNPGEDLVPQSTLCKKKCLFFVKRISAIYRREKQFVFGTENHDLKEFSENCAALVVDSLGNIAAKCTQHLEKVKRGEIELLNGVDMELIEIKLRMAPLMTELTKILQTGNKASRLGPTAFFLSRFLMLNALEHVFKMLSWAAETLLEYEQIDGPKLLIHQHALQECLLAPMNLLSLLVSGDFLKRGEIKYYLPPNELSPLIAIYKLRLTMMRQLVQPMTLHFLEEKADLYLAIADRYYKDFSRLLEGVICILSANSFFSANSAFDSESLSVLQAQYAKTMPNGASAGTVEPDNQMRKQQQSLRQQLAEMGFGHRAIDRALNLCVNDFGRALDYLCSMAPQLEDAAPVAPASEAATEEQKEDQGQSEAPRESENTQMIDTSKQQAEQPDPATKAPEPAEAMQGVDIADVKEIEAANDLEFHQRREAMIKVVSHSLVEILSNNLKNATLARRQQILTSFLLQIKKEDNASVKATLEAEILSMIRRLLADVQSQNCDSLALPADLTKHSETTGLDWILIDCIKWATACDKIKLPDELTFGRLASVIASQLQKKINHMGALVKHELPILSNEQKAEQSSAEKKDRLLAETAFSRSVRNTIFSIELYLRIITTVLEQLKLSENLSQLQLMVSEAKKQNQEASKLDDLFRITKDLEFQLRERDGEYFSGGSDQLIKSTGGRLIINTATAGAHLQEYFNCLLQFFLKLGAVSGALHDNQGSQLNLIVTKALRCLNMMAAIGTVGNFDFARQFLQRNLLKLILQAKVVDKDFLVEFDTWRFVKKVDGNPFVNYENEGRQNYQFASGMLRSIVREVCTPKKELQRRLETTLKRQLYKQFLQNFKRNEQVDFFDYLHQVAQANNLRKANNAEVAPASKEIRNFMQSFDKKDDERQRLQQQPSRTKAKVMLATSKDGSGFAKPISRVSKRSKSEEKLNSQQTKKGLAPTQPKVSNKLLKKLMIKCDQYNQSKLDDFIGFNKLAMSDAFVYHSNYVLQACAKIAVIKSVEVDNSDQGEKDKPAKGLLIKISEPTLTTFEDVKNILETVYRLKNDAVQATRVNDSVVELSSSEGHSGIDQALKQGFIRMSLRGVVHELKFEPKKDEKSGAETEAKKPIQTKTEYRIMLKRQVLREMIFDSDFNPQNNLSVYGQTGSDKGPTASSPYSPSKTQVEITHQLLEMFVEQARGIKLDILKILRNPVAACKADAQEPVFTANDTVVKIVAPKSDAQAAAKESTKFVIDTDSNTCVPKHYYLDYASILNGLLDILEKQPSVVEVILKHNDGKTLKFLLRNIFFIMSVHIDGKNDKQVIFKNMQSYNSQKPSDRLTIMITFLKMLTTLPRSATLKQQKVVEDVQRHLVSIMSKNLVLHQQSMRGKSAIPEAHNGACQQLLESARLVQQYNSVWLLTQYLFYKPKPNSINKPVDAVINMAQKLDESIKLHIVKMILLETQLLQQQIDSKTQQSQPLLQQQQQQQDILATPSSSLAFLKQIKRLLDNLEETELLFTRSKVPCMHMCIWAVTSILKVFEYQPGLFIELTGPPPPPSDSGSDNQSDRSKQEGDECSDLDKSEGGADGDHEMQSDENDQAHPHQPDAAAGSQPTTNLVPANESDPEDESDVESGEEEMEEDSYGDENFLEGNEDLSSNRDQSMGDQDMMVDLLESDGDDNDFDEDSYGSSLSEYGDEDSSALIELIPRLAIQSSVPVKGSGLDQQSFTSDLGADRSIEIPVDDQQRPLGAENAEESKHPADASRGNEDRPPFIPGDDESYYSELEQESYEPPLSYDQEDSVLSFESDNDHRDGFYGEGHGDGNGHGDDDYDDFDNMDVSGNSFSDTDSVMHFGANGHNHNQQLGHNHGHQHSHDRMIQQHHMSNQHLPIHAQLWHQVEQGNGSVVTADPLEGQVITWTNSLHSVLESVAIQQWPYTCYLQSLQAPASPSAAIADDQGEVGTDTYNIALDEQGNEIKRLDVEKFKDQPRVAEGGPEHATKAAPQSQMLAQPPQQQKSALEIDGMDPLFFEALGPQGLQNIADSHSIQNTVVNSAAQVSRDNRNQSRYENVLQTIQSQPEHLQGALMDQIQRDLRQRSSNQQHSEHAERILTAIQSQIGAQQPAQNDQNSSANQRSVNQNQQAASNSNQREDEARGRFMSVDTVAVSMLGPNDASRQVPEPQRVEKFDKTTASDQVKVVGNKVRIRGSQFMQNAFNDLQDLISRFAKNQTVTIADKQCTEMIKQHLLPQEQESAQTKFGKIHDCMQMALIGFKIFEKDDLQIQSRIRLLFRIPSLRICLILRVLKLLTGEVDNMVAHRDACQKANEFSQYKSKELMPSIVKDEMMVLQEMPINQTILVSLSIIEQLQECLQTLGLSKEMTMQSIEIAKAISSDTLLGQFVNLSGLSLHTSIIESVLVTLKRYFDTVTTDSWLLPIDLAKASQKTSLYNQVLASLRKILLPLSRVGSLKMPVDKICSLVAAPASCTKLTKQGHQHARKILNDITEKDNLQQVGTYLEVRLEKALKAMIEVLKERGTSSSDETSQTENAAPGLSFVQAERFNHLLDGTKELLKLASGIQKFKNTNICRQETLAQLFHISNTILNREQKRDESIRGQSTTEDAKSNAFMYRTDIKEMILILFALCEYNLRIVFSGAATESFEQGGTAEATTTLTQTPPTAPRPTEEESKQPTSLIETGLQRKSSSGGAPVEQQILDGQDAEIYKVIESQLTSHQGATAQQATAAATDTATRSTTLDKRLKTIIAFFIMNKKLINVFIRVNQQVVNVQLKNLVVKIPQILEFDTKRLIWRVMLKKAKQKQKSGQWDILVRRDQAFDDSFALMRHSKLEEWKTPLRITFQDEAGVDEGGLTKEWFTLLSKHMFNEDMALFLKASTGSTYFPNPKSVVQIDHLDLFEFIGKFVGKALLDSQLLECYFVKAFYKLILDMPLDYNDLEDYDQELYKSLTWILQNEGAEHLCSYFVETQDYFGENKEQELCENGSERLVTDQNKEEYVKLVANYRLKQCIAAQLNAFKGGLFQVVPKDLIKIFDNRELELLISGLQQVDIDDLRENTQYQGYNANSKPVLLFWEALREFDNSERAEFIQFVTGSSKVPVEGFKGLRGQSGIQKFTIAMVNSQDQHRLPQSHTCVNQLDLPQYKDKETMKRLLILASKEGKTFTIA